MDFKSKVIDELTKMGLEVFSATKSRSKIYSCKSYTININNDLGCELRNIVDMADEADVAFVLAAYSYNEAKATAIKLQPANMNQDNITYLGDESDLYIKMALL